jgi:FAS-associated factor 2
MNIRLPSGNRLIRKFDADSSIQALYDFVESNDLDPIDIVKDVIIVNTYPRKEYLDKSITFKEAGLFPNATVLVEEADDD